MVHRGEGGGARQRGRWGQGQGWGEGQREWGSTLASQQSIRGTEVPGLMPPAGHSVLARVSARPEAMTWGRRSGGSGEWRRDTSVIVTVTILLVSLCHDALATSLCVT